MLRRLLPSALLLVAAVSPLCSQDTSQVHPLDTITVTAERRPVSTTATAAVVRVITAEQWRARGAGDLMTILRDVPGLQLDPVVGDGAGVSIQGLGSDRVQILIDGAPVEGRLNNQLDLTRFDPAQFARIEIVEGPQSTLYGSTALGGVINLITRQADGRHLDLATEGGTFGQFDGSGRASALLGLTGIAITTAHHHVGIAPGTSVGSPGAEDRWDVGASVLQPIGSAVLDLRAMHIREAQQYQENFGPGALLDNDARNRQTDVLAALRLHDGATEVRMHASVFDHTLDETDPASGATTVDPQVQRLADIELIQRGAIGNNSWVAGVRGEERSVRSARLTGPDEQALDGALYASAEWKLSHSLSLSTGARMTVAQQWGNDLAPRLGLVWVAGPYYVKTELAHGFRAPSFTEQFSDFLNPQAFYAVKGNPDLKPESSWNVTGETGVRWNEASLYVRGFANRLRNLIEASLVGQDGEVSQFTYLNVVKAHTTGGEIGGRIRRGALAAELSYSYLDARDETSNSPLLGRAAHTVRAALIASHHSSAITAEFVRNSALPLSQDPASGAIVYEGATPRINFRATTRAYHRWDLSAGVDNAANTVPVNAIGGFGRRWFAGASWSI